MNGVPDQQIALVDAILRRGLDDAADGGVDSFVAALKRSARRSSLGPPSPAAKREAEAEARVLHSSLPDLRGGDDERDWEGRERRRLHRSLSDVDDGPRAEATAEKRAIAVKARKTEVAEDADGSPESRLSKKMRRHSHHGGSLRASIETVDTSEAVGEAPREATDPTEAVADSGGEVVAGEAAGDGGGDRRRRRPRVRADEAPEGERGVPVTMSTAAVDGEERRLRTSDEGGGGETQPGGGAPAAATVAHRRAGAPAAAAAPVEDVEERGMRIGDADVAGEAVQEKKRSEKKAKKRKKKRRREKGRSDARHRCGDGQQQQQPSSRQSGSHQPQHMEHGRGRGGDGAAGGGDAPFDGLNDRNCNSMENLHGSAVALFTIAEEGGGIDSSGRSGGLDFSGRSGGLDVSGRSGGLDFSGRSGSHPALDLSGRSGSGGAAGLDGSGRSDDEVRRGVQGPLPPFDADTEDRLPPYDIISASDAEAPGDLPHSWREILKRRDGLDGHNNGNDGRDEGDDEWDLQKGGGGSAGSSQSFEPPAFIQFVPDGATGEERRRGTDALRKLSVNERDVLEAIARARAKRMGHHAASAENDSGGEVPERPAVGDDGLPFPRSASENDRPQDRPNAPSSAGGDDPRGEGETGSEGSSGSEEDEEVLQMVEAMHTLRGNRLEKMDSVRTLEEDQLMPWDVTVSSDDDDDDGDEGDGNVSKSTCEGSEEGESKDSGNVVPAGKASRPPPYRRSSLDFDPPPISSLRRSKGDSTSSDESGTSGNGSSESSLLADESNLRGAAMAKTETSPNETSPSFGYSDSTIHSFSESNLAWMQSFGSKGNTLREESLTASDLEQHNSNAFLLSSSISPKAEANVAKWRDVDSRPAALLSRQKHFLSSARKRIALDASDRSGDAGDVALDGSHRASNESNDGSDEAREGGGALGGGKGLAKLQLKRVLKKMGSRRRVPDAVREGEAGAGGEDCDDDGNGDSFEDVAVRPCPAKRVESRGMHRRQGSYRRKSEEDREGERNEDGLWEHPNVLPRRQSSKQMTLPQDDVDDDDARKDSSPARRGSAGDAAQKDSLRPTTFVASTGYDAIVERKIAHEGSLASKRSPFGAEVVPAEDGHRKEWEPAKLAFEPGRMLRLQSSRVMKALDATAERVASVSDMLDATAEKVGSVTASRPPLGRNNSASAARRKPPPSKNPQCAPRANVLDLSLSTESSASEEKFPDGYGRMGERHEPPLWPSDRRAQLQRRRGHGSVRLDQVSDAAGHSVYHSSRSFRGQRSGGQPWRQNDFTGSREPVSWEDLTSATARAMQNSLAELQKGAPPDRCAREFRQREGVGSIPRGGGGDGKVSWDDLEDAIEVGLRSSLQDLRLSVVENQISAGIRPPANRGAETDDAPWQCAACTCVNENGMYLLCSVCNTPRMSSGICLGQS